MTAPDDLARLIAEHREVKPWVCLCGWWSAIQEPDGSDYARHLASVVSRRDADLQANAWDEGYATGVADEATSQDWTDGKVPPARVNPYRSRRPADTDTGRGQ